MNAQKTVGRRSAMVAMAMVGLLATATSASAARVLFVDSATTVDPSWRTLIESGGHTYTLFDKSTYSFSLSTQADKDYVNGFDVIVMSGSNAAFNSVRAYGAIWNALPTPMVNLGNYLISGLYSSTSWRWTTPASGGVVNVNDPSLAVADGSDPIWTGIALQNGGTTTPDLHTGNVGALTLGANSLLPNLTAVATKTATPGTIVIGHAAAGALRTGGAAEYFVAGMTGNDGTAVPYTDAGKQVFLNAITSLTGDWPSPARGTLLSVR